MTLLVETMIKFMKSIRNDLPFLRFRSKNSSVICSSGVNGDTFGLTFQYFSHRSDDTSP